MKATWRVIILLAGILGLLIGCKTERPDINGGSFYWAAKSRLVTPIAADELCSLAVDPAQDRPFRSKVIAELFATHVRPGFTSQQMRKALPETRWLDSCSLEPAQGLGGWSAVHVDITAGEKRFLLRIFTDANGWSRWNIEFVLAPRPERTLDVADARAFLTGAIQDDSVTLAEFAICYPLPDTEENLSGVSVVERFTPSGVGLLITQ